MHYCVFNNSVNWFIFINNKPAKLQTTLVINISNYICTQTRYSCFQTRNQNSFNLISACPPLLFLFYVIFVSVLCLFFVVLFTIYALNAVILMIWPHIPLTHNINYNYKNIVTYSKQKLFMWQICSSTFLLIGRMILHLLWNTETYNTVMIRKEVVDVIRRWNSPDFNFWSYATTG